MSSYTSYNHSFCAEIYRATFSVTPLENESSDASITFQCIVNHSLLTSSDMKHLICSITLTDLQPIQRWSAFTDDGKAKVQFMNLISEKKYEYKAELNVSSRLVYTLEDEVSTKAKLVGKYRSNNTLHIAMLGHHLFHVL